MGRDKESNDESLFFQKMNEWLLRQNDGSWANPMPFLEKNDCEDFSERLQEIIQSRLNSYAKYKYFGYLWNSSEFKSSEAWGWKDPRNTFTLDFWLKIFPNARIISIRRNGVDVASSLYQRYKKQRKHEKNLPKIRSSLNKKVKYFKGIGDSKVSCSLDDALRLWHEYESQVEHHQQKYLDKMLTVRYENFHSDLDRELERITTFLPEIDVEVLKREVVSNFDVSRVNSWVENEDLNALYSRNIALMKDLGY